MFIKSTSSPGCCPPERLHCERLGGAGEGGKDGELLEGPKDDIFARAPIGLNAVSHRFVLPLGPAPDPPPVGPGHTRGHKKINLKKRVIILLYY